ncbi:MAG: ABC-type transport system involved in resistance to organic solvent, permease component [Myxococcales bacterium]|nr:ABC-type transport system involved in resistance to organic solvent, permease component [Myxococcales bacterium]
MDSWQIERRDERLELAGEMRITNAATIWRTLRAKTERPGARLDIDLTASPVVDGAIMSLLVELRSMLAERHCQSDFVGGDAQLRAIVHLYRGDRPPRPSVKRARESVLAHLGGAIEEGFHHLVHFANFATDIAGGFANTLRRPRSANWNSIAMLVERAGADGLPIVVSLNFLIGFVMGFQSMAQLRLYGASIYVADIVGVSVTRELAPLMTAIIISGRSGAAYAAELGTMRVSEEIDALRTMGFSPVPYLVIPRVIALAIVAPILTLAGDVVGGLGGLVVARTSLDITPHGYLAELRTSLVLSDVWTGLVKSVAFGIAIALIGCQQGLSTRGSASGVGRATTATVVYCLFTIVILDTLFTVMFNRLGL